MEEKIRTAGIGTFREMGDAIVYRDEDIIVINSLESKGMVAERFRMECFVIGTCIEGALEVEIDYCKYRLHPGDTVFILPNTIVGRPALVANGKLRFSVFSSRFLQGTLKVDKQTWNTALLLKERPVMRRGDYATPSVFFHLSQVLTEELKGEPHHYHREVMRHLFSILFCELLGWLTRIFQRDYEDRIPDTASRPTLHVMSRFSSMLVQDGGIHRSVRYYADALCYTPKHFSKLIKDACGRTPLDIITERTIDCIRYELQHSVKTIKEIADDFDFPNQSFFGKYVKKHTGMTPQELREVGEK